MDSRGVSPVVATVLLILLTIGAVGIIAGIVIPFVKDGLTKSTACLEYRDFFQFADEFAYNCYQPGNEGVLHAVSVRAQASSDVSAEVKGFELVFLKSGASKKVGVVNGTDVSSELYMLDNSESKLVVPLPGEMLTFIYSSAGAYAGVEIYPVLGSGKVCDKSDEVKLLLCHGETEI